MNTPDYPNLLTRFQYFKDGAACDDQSAAILVLADVIQNLELDLGSAIEFGLNNGTLDVRASVDGPIGELTRTAISQIR